MTNLSGHRVDPPELRGGERHGRGAQKAAAESVRETLRNEAQRNAAGDSQRAEEFDGEPDRAGVGRSRTV